MDRINRIYRIKTTAEKRFSILLIL